MKPTGLFFRYAGLVASICVLGCPCLAGAEEENVIAVAFGRQVPGNTYPSGGGTVEVTVTFTGVNSGPTSLGLDEDLPSGWSFKEYVGTSNLPDTRSETTGRIGYVWFFRPALPFSFSYRLNVPNNTSGQVQIVGKAFFVNEQGVDSNSPEVKTTLLPTSATGSLKVTIAPPGALAAGAQWSVDSAASWHNSGVTVDNLAAGNATVDFKAISGWTTPKSQDITIIAGKTVTTSATYTGCNAGPGSKTTFNGPLPRSGDVALILAPITALLFVGDRRRRRSSIP